jgi:putative transposase
MEVAVQGLYKNLSLDEERIKEEVCRKYGVAMEELHRTRRGISNEPRNMAIYLLRSLRGDNLEEIGREFNITRFSSVSSVVARMRGKISGDRQLRNCVEEIKTTL